MTSRPSKRGDGQAPQRPEFKLLYLTKEYFQQVDKLGRSAPALRSRIGETQRCYADAELPLERSKLHNRHGRRVFHSRVNDDLRIVDEPVPSKSDEVILHFVDHHDKANNWGIKYSGDAEDICKRAKAVQTEARKASKVAASLRSRARARHPGGDEGTIGSLLLPEDLIAEGVPRATVAQVCRLPILASDNELKLRSVPDTAIALIKRRMFAVDDSVRIAPPVPGRTEPTAIVISADTLPGLLTQPLHKFLATMSDRQRQIAESRADRFQAVKGAAGSGKTVVALRRLEFLTEQKELFTEPAIYLCFNRVLAATVYQVLTQMLGARPENRNIKVMTIFQLLDATGLELGMRRGKDRLGREKCRDMLQRLRRGHEPAALRGWSDDDLMGEIGEVILGRRLRHEEEYLAVERTGRGRRLTAAQRSYVWSLHKGLTTELNKRDLVLWDAIPGRILDRLEDSGIRKPKFSAVVIDEVQDFTCAMVQCVLALQAGRRGSLLVVGDAAQNVFQRGFRWKDLGLDVAGGEAAILRETFRSTPAIVRAAKPLIESQAERLAEDLVVPEPTAFSADEEAPTPELHRFATEDAELRWVADRVNGLLNDGVVASTIGILIDGNDRRRALTALLAKRRIPYEDCVADGNKSIDVASNEVKLLTPGSAKGLEFPVVFLLGVTEWRYPSTPRNGDVDGCDRARRALYTAMLRSGWWLYMTAPQQGASKLLDQLPLDSGAGSVS